MDLYVFRLGPTSRAVLAFCHASKLELVIKDIDLLQGEHRQPAFVTMNPNGMLPLLVDDGFVLSESSAILRYLAAKSGSPLYPVDLRPRARVDELIAWFEANFYKDFAFQYVYPALLPHHHRGSDEATARTIAWGLEKSKAWLSVLDTHYLGSRRWLVTDEPTIADYFGASILGLGELTGFDLSAYPNVERWYRAVMADPSMVAVNGPFLSWVAAVRTGETAR
jgi:glutathione S-transferase